MNREGPIGRGVGLDFALEYYSYCIYLSVTFFLKSWTSWATIYGKGYVLSLVHGSHSLENNIMKKYDKLVSLVQVMDIPPGTVWTIEGFLEYPAESSTPAFGRLVIHYNGWSTALCVEGGTSAEVTARILKSFVPCIAI